MGKETGIKKESPEIADIFPDATGDTLKKGEQTGRLFLFEEIQEGCRQNFQNNEHAETEAENHHFSNIFQTIGLCLKQSCFF